MSVALVHYHLRPGGVTRVLEIQSAALTRAGRPHVILSGTPYAGSAPLPVEVVPGLAYRDTRPDDGLQSETLLHDLRRAARTALQCEPSCWHIHNPTLGKNSLFPLLITGLAESLTPLVLHLHDFAEEGRPANYKRLPQANQLYPLAPQIRYAVINSRARNLLVSAGVPEDQCTLFPNAIDPGLLPTAGHTPVKGVAGPLVLYPVRGIRRKNLGEFCLLASLAPSGATFALSLPPENPEWKAVYDGWVDTVSNLDLPVRLGVVGSSPPGSGASSTYSDWVQHATHLITTSVAEGFGLTFLESLALGKPLIGRDLPGVTCDFTATVGRLYQKLLVPAAWVDEQQLREHLHNALRRSYRAYGESMPGKLPAQVREHLACSHGGHAYLDFGNLPEELQAEILPQACNSPADVVILEGGRSQPAGDWIREALDTNTAPGDASALAAYSVENYARRHESLYKSLTTTAAAPPRWLDKRRLLSLFLRPERFHFLQA